MKFAPAKKICEFSWSEPSPASIFHEIFEKFQFSKILKLVKGSATQITNFLRWREFHCLAAPRFIFQVFRRVVAPSRNTAPGLIAEPNAHVQIINFRCSRVLCFLESDSFRKPPGSINSNCPWLGPVLFSCFAVAK